MKRYCELCKSLVTTLEMSGQVICSVCGFIIAIDKDYLYTSYNQLESSASNIPLGSTFKKDYTGKFLNNKISKDLARAFQKTRVISSKERNRYKGSGEIDRLVKSLNLPYFLGKKILEKFNMFNDKNLLKNRNLFGIVVSLTIIQSNIENVPLSISEALRVTGLSRKKFNKQYFYLYYLHERPEATSAAGVKHLEKFLSLLEPWSKMEEFKKTLTEALKICSFNNLQGRDAIVAAGTILLYLLKYYGYSKTESFIKNIVINRLTLKNYWLGLLNNYPYFKKFDLEKFTPPLDIP